MQKQFKENVIINGEKVMQIPLEHMFHDEQPK